MNLTKQLRVLLLITNVGKGGAQRVVHDHAVAFREYFHVEEATFDRSHDERIYDSGRPILDLTRDDWLSRAGRVGRLLSRARALKRLVEERNYDVVVSHLDGANWVNVLSRSAARKIVVLHGSVLHDQGQTWLRRWLRIHMISRVVYDQADCAVAVSAGVASELRAACRINNVRTIYNFFDVRGIRSKAAESLCDAEAAVFAQCATLISSGRLTIGKRQGKLLAMVAELKRRGEHVRLVLLGDGELRDDLILQSKGLGLRTFDTWSGDVDIAADHDVYFLGYVSNPYKYLKRATLFVFPSAWEGFPLALCEAMICGTVVMSADCPTGPREILAPDSGIGGYDLRTAEFTDRGVLLPMIQSPGDLVEWVTTVQILLADTSKRQRMACCAELSTRALQREIVVRQWLDLIASTAHGC